MDSIKDFDYPIWAIGLEPVPRDSMGRPLVESTKFFIQDDAPKSPLWIVFRDRSLISPTFDEFDPSLKYQEIKIKTVEQFHYLLRQLRVQLGCPIGVLVDPDRRMQGFPLPPQNWPGIATG